MKKTFKKAVQALLETKVGRLANLVGVFLVAGTLSLCAETYASQHALTLNLKNATIREAIESIKSQSEFSFSMDVKDLNLDEKVSVSLANKSINEILAVLFNGKNVRYEINDRHIVITHTDKQSAGAVQQQAKKITGKIADPNGEPIIGANVVVKGTTNGTITDGEGQFSLDVPGNAILKVTYIGYMEQEVPVGSKSTLSIIMKEDSQTLDEVVVVGFGTQKKLNLTGAVTAVSGDEIAKRPVANAAVMLQGQIPGLRVNQGNGQPGNEEASFRIRGQGTFSDAGSDPLILINGVPGSMTNLDPSTIESVSVLKDAASAAIYGARAANGVILVTTRQGSSNGQKVTIGYHGNVGLYTPTKMYDVVTNSVEFMELSNIAKTNSGRSDLYSQDIINQYKQNAGTDQYPSFDWLDYMFRTAVVQTHNLSIAGNADKTTYNISLNYVNQPGTMRGFDYKKYNVTLDLTSQINKFIKVGAYSNMMLGDRKEPRQGQGDSFLSTLAQAPTYKPWLPDDGSGITRWTSSAYAFEGHNKNIPAIIGTNTMKTYENFDINSQLWLEVSPVKGLTWFTKGAARLQSDKRKDWRGMPEPIYLYHTGEQVNNLDKGGLGLEDYDERRFYTNLYTYLKYEYTTPNKDHNFALMVGYNQETEKYQTLTGYRRDYAFNLPTIDAGGQTGWSNAGKVEEWAIQSGFGRFNYNFKDRYLFEANMRYDGTSRISSENRWGWFPSFSGAWRITEESFIKNMNLNWLTNAKIRGSWGLLGNQNIGLYPYQAMIAGVTDYPYNKSDMTVGYQQIAYANRNIKWEATAITNIGVDLMLLNRLNVTFEWYNKVTDDILRASQVSDLLGLTAPTINNGKVQNKGVELSLGWNDVITSGAAKGLQYNVGVNFSRNKNELVNFGKVEYGDYGIRQEGLPYGEFFMLESLGVFADQAEIDKAPKQFNDDVQPGDLRYMDWNNDGKIDNDDRHPVSGRFPAFEYAVTAGVNWKGFDLSLIGQGVSNVKYYTTYFGAQPFAQGGAVRKDYLESMWTPEKPNGAEHPKLYYDNMGGTKNTRDNTYFLRNASYFRLKNLTFGYTLPRQLTENAYISRVRVYFSGDNLFTITPFKGIDPERKGNGWEATYPQNKICSFGINVEF